ncbi:MAG: hypothetical protein QXM92_02720, partial [Candidatus Anstonellales archaeon]
MSYELEIPPEVREGKTSRTTVVYSDGTIVTYTKTSSGEYAIDINGKHTGYTYEVNSNRISGGGSAQFHVDSSGKVWDHAVYDPNVRNEYSGEVRDYRTGNSPVSVSNLTNSYYTDRSITQFARDSVKAQRNSLKVPQHSPSPPPNEQEIVLTTLHNNNFKPYLINGSIFVQQNGIEYLVKYGSGVIEFVPNRVLDDVKTLERLGFIPLASYKNGKIVVEKDGKRYLYAPGSLVLENDQIKIDLVPHLSAEEQRSILYDTIQNGYTTTSGTIRGKLHERYVEIDPSQLRGGYELNITVKDLTNALELKPIRTLHVNSVNITPVNPGFVESILHQTERLSEHPFAKSVSHQLNSLWNFKPD